jgi:hypothetical protein
MNNNRIAESEIQKGAKPNRDVVGEAMAQLERIKHAGLNVREEAESFVVRRPLVALGIAGGAGFVLGGLFGSRLGRVALMAAVGYAAQEVVHGALGEGGVRKLVADEISKFAKKMEGSKFTE